MVKTKFFACLLTLLTAATAIHAEDLTRDIPPINLENTEHPRYKKIPNVAQYKNSDWSQAIGIARGVTLTEAMEIANNSPDITYFFYVKGFQLVLETTNGDHRLFHYGDTVFFSGTPWWGSAIGLADGYVKAELTEQQYRSVWSPKR